MENHEVRKIEEQNNRLSKEKDVLLMSREFVESVLRRRQKGVSEIRELLATVDKSDLDKISSLQKLIENSEAQVLESEKVLQEINLQLSHFDDIAQ